MACAQAPALSWGKGGQESLAPCEKLSHSTTSWVCMLERGREHMFVCVYVYVLVASAQAGAGVRSGQLSLSLQVGQVGRINFLFCPSHTVLALFHGSNSAQGIEIHCTCSVFGLVFYSLFSLFSSLYSP